MPLTPRFAIIGCGLIGQKRAKEMARGSLGICCDRDERRAGALSSAYPGSKVSTNWQDAISDPEVDAVVVATAHDSLASIAAAAASAGKHVLIEKPGARNASELDALVLAAQATGVRVRVGFNHRYHRAFQKAREILATGVLGPLCYIRARYGHGGRPGYDKEWRAVREISGGGELVDQGVHLIDLSRWFLGDFTSVQGRVGTYFWDMPVEDNGFLLLGTAAGQTALLHASWTEWKNLFSFEIFGRTGKLEISGLGGSYGVERLSLYAMTPEMGPPPTTIWEFPMADNSWQMEMSEFIRDIEEGRDPDPGVRDAQAALRVCEAVYAQSAAAGSANA